MSDKLKRALGFFISAGLFATAGVVTLLVPSVPPVVPVVLNAAVMVAASFGIANVVKPEL